MRRAAPSLSVPTDLLKHFGVATVVLTACVAMFADGSKQTVIKQQLAAQEARNKLKQAEAEKLGPIKIGTSAASRQGAYHEVDSSLLPSAEAPAANPASAGSAGFGGSNNDLGRASMSDEQLANMPRVLPPGTPPELQRQRDMLAAQKGRPPSGRMTAEQRAKMIEAAEQRSGKASD